MAVGLTLLVEVPALVSGSTGDTAISLAVKSCLVRHCLLLACDYYKSDIPCLPHACHEVLRYMHDLCTKGLNLLKCLTRLAYILRPIPRTSIVSDCLYVFVAGWLLHLLFVGKFGSCKPETGTPHPAA